MLKKYSFSWTSLLDVIFFVQMFKFLSGWILEEIKCLLVFSYQVIMWSHVEIIVVSGIWVKNAKSSIKTFPFIILFWTLCVIDFTVINLLSFFLNMQNLRPPWRKSACSASSKTSCFFVFMFSHRLPVDQPKCCNHVMHHSVIPLKKVQFIFTFFFPKLMFVINSFESSS